MRERLRYWFLDTFGKRSSIKTYIGHGDYTEEFGWEFMGQFYSKSRRMR